MTADAQRAELKQFLRARRAAVAPAIAGLRATGRRRTPGLRREEVATLAGVSVTWYTWLEQGRDIQCSSDLLARLGRALRLSPSDTAYLFRLAGYPAPTANCAIDAINPRVQEVLDGFTAGPAFVLGPRMDVLAFNKFADAIFRFDAFKGPFAQNHIWRGFMDPERRNIYLDWEELLAKGVGALRAHYASRIGDKDFEKLIAALKSQSKEFVRMWEEHRTIPLNNVTVRMQPRGWGLLTFNSVRFGLPTLSDHIIFFLSPADKSTAAALSRWTSKRANKNGR
jgi:transcriptional regulator with XRE-family HTH domain